MVGCIKTYFLGGKVVVQLCYSNWITGNQDNCVTDKLKPHITPTKKYLFRIPKVILDFEQLSTDRLRLGSICELVDTFGPLERKSFVGSRDSFCEWPRKSSIKPCQNYSQVIHQIKSKGHLQYLKNISLKKDKYRVFLIKVSQFPPGVSSSRAQWCHHCPLGSSQFQQPFLFKWKGIPEKCHPSKRKSKTFLALPLD